MDTYWSGGVGLAIERGLCHGVSASSPRSSLGVSALYLDEGDFYLPYVEELREDMDYFNLKPA